MLNKNYMMGDIANIRSGCSYRGAESKLAPGSIPFVGYRNVGVETGIDWQNVARVDLEVKRAPQWLEDEDVIFASRGTQTYAYPVIAPPPNSTCSPQFFVITPKDNAVLSAEFLAWQINQPPVQSYLDRFADASTIRNIRREVLANMSIVVPSLERQHLIAGYAKTARRAQHIHRALIENTNRELNALASDLMNGNI